MLVLVSLLRRRPDLTPEEFTRHHRERHAPLFVSMPAVRRLVRRYTVESPAAFDELSAPEFDAVVRQWFDDADAVRELLASSDYRDTVLPDERRFIDHPRSTFYVTEEDVVTGPELAFSADRPDAPTPG